MQSDVNLVNSPSSSGSWEPLSQQISYIPTVSTHHGIEVGVGLATGRDHSVMTGLDEALSRISYYVLQGYYLKDFLEYGCAPTF